MQTLSLESRSMLLSSITSTSRRTIWMVLLAWLCVMTAGVAAPVVRAQTVLVGMEQLCSGDFPPRWVPSPVGHGSEHDAASLAQHHLIDCPLCLPVLAPPAQASPIVAAPPRAQGPALMQVAGPAPQRNPWPPVRAPPVSTGFHS